MKEIKIGELMNRKVVTTSMDADPLEVATIMRNNRLSCIVVADLDKPLGIVTERDIVRLFVDNYRIGNKQQLRLKDVVTSPVITISKNSTLFDAMVLIESRKIRHLPVVDNKGKLSGIVTYSELVRNHQRMMDDQIEIIEKEVKDRTRELTEANDQLHALSLEDHLLKIGNRRAMEVDLKYTHEAAVRYKRPYSVALIDVDHFKKYNDRYGHKAGDSTLQKVVNSIKKIIRTSDRMYRYGGEEFLLLLPETQGKNAYILVQRLLTCIVDLNIRHEKSPVGRVTVSTGIASDDGNSCLATWGDLVANADEALYQAKNSGRNMCVVSDKNTICETPGTPVNKSAA